MPSGTYHGHPTLSETNSEPSRAHVFHQSTCTQHISHLSDAGPSRYDPMTIHDDSWVNVSVSSHSPEQGQDPELSALDIPPLTSGGQFITANVRVVFPAPRMHISSLGPVLTFVREMKGKSLEELGQIFAVHLGTHAAYGLRQIPHGFKFVLFQNLVPEQLYQLESESKEARRRRGGR